MSLLQCSSISKLTRLFTSWCSNFCENLYDTVVKLFPFEAKNEWGIPLSYGVITGGKVFLPNIFQRGVVQYDMESGMSLIFLESPVSTHEKYSEILLYDSDNNQYFLKNVHILSSIHIQGIIPKANCNQTNVFLYGSECSSINHPFYITSPSYQKYDPLG